MEFRDPAPLLALCPAPLDLVMQVAETLAGVRPLADRMAEASRQIQRGFGADGCVIRALESDDLALVCSSGISTAQLVSRLPAKWGIAKEILDTARPLFIPNITVHPVTAPNFATLPRSYDFTAYFGVPLIAEGQTVGIAGLYYTSSRTEPLAHETELLQLLANSLAVTLLNARLLRDLQTMERQAHEESEARKAAEADLLHAQRTACLGQFTADITHDFNNLLTVIMGYSEFASEELGEAHPVQSRLACVMAASKRADALTGQLLTFTGKHIVAPNHVRLGPLIRDTAQMAIPLLGKRIHLLVETPAEFDTIFIDPGQMEQVLINLLVNARDAMPFGGQITVRVTSIQTPGTAAPPEYTLRPLVCLEVRDTGTGMTETVKNRLFESFYTTKEAGKGTGLGLAICSRIISAAGGRVEVESTPGQGSLFRILLPAAGDLSAPYPALPGENSIPPGHETVLVIEDDEAIRDIIVHVLSAHGYTVWTAETGCEGLEIALERGGTFSLLIVDAAMADMSGYELGRRMDRLYPHKRMLFLSGSLTGAACEAESRKRGPTLAKPFSPKQFARAVRAVLDSAELDPDVT